MSKPMFNSKPISQLKSEKYVSTGGVCCPHCKSDNISCSHSISTDETGQIMRTVECYNCTQQWNEFYQLIAIKSID